MTLLSVRIFPEKASLRGMFRPENNVTPVSIGRVASQGNVMRGGYRFFAKSLLCHRN